MGQSWKTCGLEVRSWVEATVAELSERIGPGSIGAYLHGSLASGSFYLPKSDIDLLFVAAQPLEIFRRRAFAESCVQLHRLRPVVGGLECSVILAPDAARTRHPMPFEVHFGEEWVADIEAGRIDHGRARSDPDLVAHCQATLEFGRALAGDPVSEVFGSVDRDDFLDSIRADLEWILEGDHLLESPVYGVLNACRALWLWNGHSQRLVPTKEEAALWAGSVVPPEHGPLIAEALAAYRDSSPVRERERQTAGRVWQRTELHAFRDWMRLRWESRALEADARGSV